VAPSLSKEEGNGEYKECLKEVFRCLLDARRKRMYRLRKQS